MEKFDIFVREIRISEEDTIVAFRYACGQFDISLGKDKDKIDFIPGEKYVGYFESSISADFLGDKPEEMRIGTNNFYLKKIKSLEGKVLYKTKKR